jgi:predicted RNase H-like nuclease
VGGSLPVIFTPHDEASGVVGVGVDGCRAGWFWVCLTRAGGWKADIAPTFSQICDRWTEAGSILVDIPIGLRDSGEEERLCDREARKALGAPRSSSVFPVPCRSSLDAQGYRDACRINKQYTGRRLSKQSWNIAGKIREVDALLHSNAQMKGVVREVHPEVLFWALNRGIGMKHSKRTEAGFKDRLRLLERYCPGSEAMVTIALNTYPRKAVGRDDMLDALAAAVTGWLGTGSFRAFPECPEWDSTGLPMEIVYSRG